jgi:hypothetical protein
MGENHHVITAAKQQVAGITWDGKEYELRYTFGIVRRLRAEGLNFPQLFRECMADPNVAADRGDEIAEVIAWVLREAGAKDVTAEMVWRRSLGLPEFRGQCFALFIWIGTQHFASSDTAPKLVATKRKNRPR